MSAGLALQSASTEARAHPNPYVGLRPFMREDSRVFFGRREQTIALLALLRESRFLPVVGSSGSGKSSLVRAGLVPALLGGFLVQDRDQWLIATMKPGDAPLYNLARALLETAKGSEDASADELVKNIAVDPFDAVFSAIAARVGERTNLLLVVDQFEELFAFRGDPEAEDQAARDDRGRTGSQRRAEADDFVSLLLELAEAKELAVYVVLTMRSDFAGDCDLFRGLPEAMNRTRYLVPRLRREQLRQAIEGPALLAGVALAPRLLDRVLNEMGDRSDQLPVLQHALLQTWEQWRKGAVAADGERNAGQMIEQQHYEAAGTLGAALSRHAAEVFDVVDRRLAELLFKRLTDTDVQGRRVRRATSFGDLHELALASGFQALDVARALEAFQAGNRHFVSVAEADDRDERRVDISHESLIRQWPALRDWVDQERIARDELRTLIAQRARHERAGRSKPTLLQEADLAVAEQWKAQRDLNATWARRYAAQGEYEAVLAYIERSKRELTRAQQRRNRTIIAVGAVLLVLAMAAAGWAAYAVQQNRLAMRAARLAYEQTGKATQALAKNLFDEGQQALAAGAAWKAADQLAQSYKLAPDGPVRLLLPHAIALSTGLDGAVLKAGAAEIVNRARFSPDGTRVVTASDDNTARIWEVPSGRLVAALSGHDDVVNDASFSPNGDLVLSSSSDNQVRIWDARTGKLVALPLDGQDAIMAAEFHGRDAHVITANQDGGARVWTLANVSLGGVAGAATSVKLKGYRGAVAHAVFSGDGSVIVTTSEDGSVRVWNAGSGVQLLDKRTAAGRVFQRQVAALSPDGTRVATSTQDEPSTDGVSAVQNPMPATVSLWNAETGKLEHTLIGHTDAVSTVAFSSDGALLVSASSDRTARVWDAQGNLLSVLQGHEDQVLAASFSPDGERVVTVSRDETARLWYARTGHVIAVLPGHTDSVIDASFSDDGKRVVTASHDGSARLWNITASVASAILRHEDLVSTASFSPDGTRVITASSDKTARLWNASSGAALAQLSHQAAVNSASFSPDGARIVTASDDLTAVVWDARTARLLVRVYHDEPVTTASFNPDGTRILTASRDKTAVVWDATNGKQLLVLRADDAVQAAAFSRNGKLVLTRIGDDAAPVKTVSVWDALSGKLLAAGLGEAVAVAAFSPDSASIVTGAYESTTFWDAPKWTARPKRDDGEVTALSFDLPGSRLVAAKGGWARILDAKSLEHMVELEGHRDRIKAVSFSPDGSWVVTGSDDLTTRVWDAATGRVLLTFEGHQGPINTATFSHDSNRLVTASSDHTARIWNTTLAAPSAMKLIASRLSSLYE